MINRKKYIKRAEGSVIPYQALGDSVAQLYDGFTPTNQYGAKTDFNAGLVGGLKGAGQGAAIGTSIAPGIGTAIGAGVGLIAGGVQGVLGNNKAQTEQTRQESLLALMERNKSNAVLRNYDTTGSNQNNIYAELGGKVPLSKYTIGGNLNKIATNRFEVEGNTHAEGGVKDPINNVELEDNETVSGDYVFSDKLGFADKHKKLIKQMGKMEKKPENPITKQTLEFLKKKEQGLMVEQESLRNMLGL